MSNRELMMGRVLASAFWTRARPPIRIGAVMDAQTDLVSIRHRLRQVVNVKG